jgi:hypothetical protein
VCWVGGLGEDLVTNLGDQMSSWKIHPKCSQNHFCPNYFITFPNIWASSVIFKKLLFVNNCNCPKG